MAIVWPFQKSQGNIVINHLAFHTMRNLPHCILWGARNEVQVVSRKTNQGCHGAKGALCYDHWAAFRRLDLEASRNWILSNAHARTMGHGSFILCKLCLAMPGFIFPPVSLNLVEYNPGFYHLAWGCPCRPNPLEPPDNILLARFGWSSLVIFGWSFGFVPISNACANPSGPTATVAQPPLGGARTL